MDVADFFGMSWWGDEPSSGVILIFLLRLGG